MVVVHGSLHIVEGSFRTETKFFCQAANEDTPVDVKECLHRPHGEVRRAKQPSQAL